MLMWPSAFMSAAWCPVLSTQVSGQVFCAGLGGYPNSEVNAGSVVTTTELASKTMP